MEELLNKLIEKGWKPRGEEKIHSCRYYEEEKKFKADYTIAGIQQVLYRSIRELVSKESGLWQFVCENGMVKSVGFKYSYFCNTSKINYMCNSYQYRLIESALKDESELEDFLLSNIVIKDE